MIAADYGGEGPITENPYDKPTVHFVYIALRPLPLQTAENRQAAASAQSVASGQSAASSQAGASNLIAKAGQLMNDTESVTRRGELTGSMVRRIDAAFDATVNRFDREIATWPRMEDDEFVARVTHLHAAIAELPRNDGYSQEPWGCEPALSTDF